MTPINLQDDLVEELGQLFEPFLYKVPLDLADIEEDMEEKSEAEREPKRVPLNIYSQALPVQQSDADSRFRTLS